MRLTKTKKTDPQYKTRNKRNTFILTKRATIIHLKLKTEDQAIISLMFFFLIMDTAPKTHEAKMNKTTVFFNCSNTKKVGANFCQVNKIALINHLDLLETSINH